MNKIKKTLIVGLITIYSISITNAEIYKDNYNDSIKKEGDEIIKNYLKEDNKSYIKNDKDYKGYIDLKIKLLEKKVLDKNKVDRNFKILDEYNRLLNLENIGDIGISQTSDNYGKILNYSSSQIAATNLYPYYNRNSAISYALNWAGKRNSNYSYYTGLRNCTNFTSQVLKAGGMPDSNDGTINGRTKKENWYYGSFYQIPTYTWGGAHNFFTHAAYSTSKYQNVNSFGQLSIGDLIQLDYGKTGIIKHSMVVTNITGAGVNNIYLTYSNDYDNPSNDKINVPLSTILSNYPQTNNNYYSWKVIY